ncbi:NF-kappa-B inhibitor delta isoform X5 [Ochotona princeps]|uniref:NF-kappa-B inhibitor delta isoform X5 n=1 Tax=Ochotona princeps TaxID=9978 RepID=UPI0027146531|nr:NF-kappa-B inhibitor delta isoform X5 [Ochotona princeps]
MGALLPHPQFPLRWWKVGSEGKRGVKGRKRRGRAPHPRSVGFGLPSQGGATVCQVFRAGGRGRGGLRPHLLPSRDWVNRTPMTSSTPSAPSSPSVSRHERSHCPTQTVKKLLEEQRRRQQQPDAGGVAVRPRNPGQLPPPQPQPPSVPPPMNEVEAGHAHFPGHQETGGPGSQAPATGFPDWDPNMHAAYPDSTYAHPVPAAQGFPTPDFYPPWDPGRSCQFPLEDHLDARLYAEPPLAQAGSWRASGLPPGPPQLPPSAGPSLDTARAHMLALGPQQLLAQDEEGDTLLHLLAARGLRWAAYAAAEVLQAYRQLDVREHKGKTPLLVAAAANQPLIVEDLLNLGAEPNATDHRGRSILHVAATYGLPGVLSAVFNSGVQVDLEARDFEGAEYPSPRQTGLRSDVTAHGC